MTHLCYAPQAIVDLAAFSVVDLEIAEVTRTTAAAATVVRLAVRLTHRVRVLAQVTALNFPLPIFLSKKSSLGKGSSLMQAVASLKPRGSLLFVSRASDIRRATRKSLLSALFLR